MKILLCLLFQLHVVHGKFYGYQISSLKPKLISMTNEGGSINVTVAYEQDSLVRDAQNLWWVNGKLITDGDYNFRVNFMFVGGVDLVNTEVSWSSENPRDEDVHRASILVPPGFNVTSLQLELVSDVQDTTLDIRMLPLEVGKSRLSYVPKYKLKMDPKDRVTYGWGNDLNFKIFFKADDLGRFEEPKAEFTGVDTCTTPPLVDRKTSEKDKNFFLIREPSWEVEGRDMSYDEMTYIDDNNKEVRRLNVTYDVTGSLPKGLLRVKTGYRSKSSCLLLAGVKIAYFAFLQPQYSHDDYFPRNWVAFVKSRKNYYVDYGSDVDFSVTAIGGYTPGGRTHWSPAYPEVWVVKGGQNVTAIADVKRLFQREVTVRLRHVTEAQAGRYVAVAKIGEMISKMTINIYVQNITPVCRQQ